MPSYQAEALVGSVKSAAATAKERGSVKIAGSTGLAGT